MFIMGIEDIARNNTLSLGVNTYPGRGIVAGAAETGNLVQVYWVMGRSENSRNRKLITDGDTVKTEAFDPSKVSDPSLIIYNVMRRLANWHVVSNGNQTDTVYSYLMNNIRVGDLADALNDTFHEPDAPNYTPRITALTHGYRGGVTLSKISQNPSRPDSSVRSYYHYSKVEPGYGFCLHTYNGDGSPLPSFGRDPYLVRLAGDVQEIAETYWGLLNHDNRVALAAKSIGLPGDVDQIVIINALTGR